MLNPIERIKTFLTLINTPDSSKGVKFKAVEMINMIMSQEGGKKNTEESTLKMILILQCVCFQSKSKDEILELFMEISFLTVCLLPVFLIWLLQRMSKTSVFTWQWRLTL